MTIKKILVVDDSAMDRMYLTDMLKKAGYMTETAESAEDCLARIGNMMPDLVVMDVVMPGMNGFQATRALTKDAKTAHIPIIVCSGKSQETDKAWALKMGAKECLAKPLDETILLNVIKGLG